MLELRHVSKSYHLGDTIISAVHDISLTIQAGEFVSIMGPSGSGKSTLLHLVGGLDTPDTGEIIFQGRDLHRLNDQELSRYRSLEIGFVFQTFNLIPHLTALQNVEIPLIFNGSPAGSRNQLATHALSLVGLTHRLHHHPAELSGGERQRVAIARALVHQPHIILADEPTGNLDSATGEEILKILESLNRDHHLTLIMITHDARLAARAGTQLKIHDGHLLPAHATT